MLSLGVVNVYFLDTDEPGEGWALVDTGLPWHFSAIVREARRRYGNTAPTGIYLTHGHYDHAGSAAALAAYWSVPVFAHEAELPFLTGQCDYPPADPSSCGGWLSLASHFASTHGRDLRPYILPLTEGPQGWEPIPLPGHTLGQVGFWQESSRTLIAGDALMNLKVDKWLPRKGLSWPPPPFTTDWFAVRKSLERILALEPQTLYFGHGEPLTELAPGELAERTEWFAIARAGRYVGDPVRQASDGNPIVAPIPPDPTKRLTKALVLGALATSAYFLLKNKQNS
ncbi:MBL fold metallo-hydrolase [Armatimonas rosea]|uniref:Glyoxylase-like metal-dependent hydrolase (Beta-lactamase superfamily II) n=1 Tax=Armatimonas rosea TaxID=685828 RepID=A0A7W9SPL1_ARMRO|nr:MBL fold metallo-hydrolase [Armatimonas rosea]MBB6050502.1 glyoxylase-like metal-dependent hydrolase (beta-lactamase superfamily II) [Armatimonas rosea]